MEVEEILKSNLEFDNHDYQEEFVELSRTDLESDISRSFLFLSGDIEKSEYSIYEEDIEEEEESIFHFDPIDFKDLDSVFQDNTEEEFLEELITYNKSKYLDFGKKTPSKSRKKIINGKPSLLVFSNTYSDFIKVPKQRKNKEYKKNVCSIYSVLKTQLSGLDIHHIDLNRENNSKENLILLEEKVHRYLHILLDYEAQLEIFEFFEKNLHKNKVILGGIGTTYKKDVCYLKIENPRDRTKIIKEEKERILNEISKIINTGLFEKIEIARKIKESKRKHTYGNLLDTFQKKWCEYLKERELERKLRSLDI